MFYECHQKYLLCICRSVVLPGAYIHGTIDDNAVDSVELVVLFHNPSYPLVTGELLFHDTRSPGASAEKISDCAKVSNFRNVNIYSIPCFGHNVLLKYIGNGQVVPRIGNSIERIGIFARISGRRGNSKGLDFSTNIETLSKTFNIAV